MKILILEDEVLVAEYLSKVLLEQGYRILGIAESVTSAMAELDKLPDLCLVDIRLSDNQSGIDFGKELHKRKIPFIYLTANNESHTIKMAAETYPQAFLTKPFNARDILSTLELVKYKVLTRKTLKIRLQQGFIDVNLDGILYLKADNVYTEIYLENGKHFVERKTLKDIEGELNETFIRVHRSFIINTTKIEVTKVNSVVIAGIEIPFSKKFSSRNLLG